MQIIKTDANTGEPIACVTYTVKKGNSSALAIVTTDKNGEAWVYALDEGVYQVTEQSVPTGYLLDTEPQLITLMGGRTGVVQFQNYPRPKLCILKLDAVTGEPLANAEFRVSKVDSGTVGEYITDETGEIIIENLDVARYRVEKFLAPDGYLLYDKYREILLEAGKTSTLKFDDIRKPTLIITKTNALTYEPIPNTTYQIRYEKSGGGVYTLGTYRTDSSGQIIINNAEPGWYKAAESKAPDGYLIDDTPQDFEITNNQFIKLTFENKAQASIQIKKTDKSTGAALSGAVFEVRKQDGSYIGEHTTGSDDTISIPAVEPGWYVISEAKAPARYILNSTAKTVEVKATVPTVVSFTNKALSGLQIIKLNSVTRQPIEGAEFAVAHMNGERVGTYKTDSNGLITLTELDPGCTPCLR